jgi:ribosomal protein S18 acetylase RimI-like enzyme
MLKIRKTENKSEIPFELLLEADPSREMLDHNLQNGDCYLGFDGDELVGAYVLNNTKLFTWEVSCLAVKASYRKKGYGKFLLLDAIKRAKVLGAKFIEIGTGNSNFNQLALYQKCGFRITHVYKDFFLKNYKNPIFENGIRIADMIRLTIDFTL